MKKLLLIIWVQLMVLAAISAQNVEVPETQRPMIVKITASWCPLCGGWGWSFFDDIYSDNQGEAIFLSVHHSGEHTNMTASEMTGNFSVFGQPRFLLDGIDQNVSSSNTLSKRGDFEAKVDASIATEPSIQTGIDARYSGDQILLDYSVKAFENLDGEYYVAFYLAEKVFIGYQASVGNDAQHRDLLRKELSGNTFGMILSSGSILSGDVFNGTLQADLEGYNPENVRIVSIIWKKEGSDYQVVNTNVDNQLEEDISSGVIENKWTQTYLSVYPTIVNESIDTEIFLNERSENMYLVLRDLHGRILHSKQISNRELGEQQIVIDRQPSWRAGMYLLSLHTSDEVITRKLIFK